MFASQSTTIETIIKESQASWLIMDTKVVEISNGSMTLRIRVMSCATAFCYFEDK